MDTALLFNEMMFFLLAGAVAGGFINGLAGTGTALFTLGFWLQAIAPVDAVAMVLAISIITGVQGMVLVWRSITWRRVAWFVLPALLAMPIGAYLVQHINASALKLIVAGFLIVYGGFFSFRRSLPLIENPPKFIDGGVGFLAGILGALGGLSGALPTMWCALRTWSKTEQRALLQPFNMMVLSTAALIFLSRGAYTSPVLVNLFIAIPVALASSLIGVAVYKKLTDAQFRRLLIGMMLVSGVLLLAQELVLN